jgi:hypothetical protein
MLQLEGQTAGGGIESGIEHARAVAMSMARSHYRDSVARAKDVEAHQDSEIKQRRWQAEYAVHVQREMRQEIEQQRADFLKAQAQAKHAYQRREKEYRMAPTTLYPAAFPQGRSALWHDQQQRVIAAEVL